MLEQILAWLVLVCLVLLGLADLQRLLFVAAPNQPTAKEAPAKTPRPLRPRSPEDCPACCAGPSVPSLAPAELERDMRESLKTLRQERLLSLDGTPARRLPADARTPGRTNRHRRDVPLSALNTPS